ncbi:MULTISPECIES: hypothetical protein [unclassified Oleiphilus]|uniref:hypothetical protein n=1 Tax=unclassified Oleiphilus TaxID=2631174 RepID=UPI0007C28D99|nr:MULTISPECIES: hypothetical protein [unclassified Oleiphilus]KZY63860.1 hypothetical protein A3738_01965 [Oleiphilus sp. HI0066]KZY67499.1 hypothetical protein A3739_12525 [Oleiphilus sp. HI0067]
MKWKINESHKVKKESKKLAAEIVQHYQAWKQIIIDQGLEGMLSQNGLHEEHLHGGLSHERSDRLNQHFRVIYRVDKKKGEIHVEDISPHAYRAHH